MRLNAMETTFENVSVFGHEMLFSNFRIAESTVPEGLFLYEVRDDGCNGDPVEIALGVMVNHWGTLITDQELPLILTADGRNAYLYVDSKKDWRYIGTASTVKEYLERKKGGLIMAPKYNIGDKVTIKHGIEDSRLCGAEVAIRNIEVRKTGINYMVELKDGAFMGGMKDGGCWFWIEEAKLTTEENEEE